MKITYIHQHFRLPQEGGGSRPYEFARRLADDGHQVTMICGGAESFDRSIDGFRVIRLGVPYRNAMGFKQRVASFLKFMVAASGTAMKLDADVVFASSTPLTVAVPGILGSRARRVPFVFEVRDVWPDVPIRLGLLTNPVLKFLARALEKVAYHAAEEIVALSPGMRDGVLAVAPQAAVTVIPNASDFALFDKPAAERAAFRDAQGWGDDIVIVYAGGFGYVYELEWALELAKALEHDGIRFILIGQGSTTPQLHEKAAALGLDVAAVLPGGKPKTEVASFVSAADIVLSAMRPDEALEPASLNKVFDALAASRPVIANHGGWLTDLLEEHAAGWRLDRDIARAAEQVRTIVAERAELGPAGERAAALGREKFSRDGAYAKLADVLQRVGKPHQGNQGKEDHE